MVRSWNWPDLRSAESKFRDIRFVGTDAFISSWNFHIDPLKTVVTVQSNIFEVGSLDPAWDDLGLFFFCKNAKRMHEKACKNGGAAPPFSAVRKKSAWCFQNDPHQRKVTKMCFLSCANRKQINGICTQIRLFWNLDWINRDSNSAAKKWTRSFQTQKYSKISRLLFNAKLRNTRIVKSTLDWFASVSESIFTHVFNRTRVSLQSNLYSYQNRRFA